MSLRTLRDFCANRPALPWGVGAALICAIMATLQPALGEEGLLLHGAERMVQGDHLYRDMISFTGPFPFELLAMAFRLFGENIWIARGIVALGHGVAAWSLFVLARAAGAGPFAHAVAGVWTAAPVLTFPLLSNFYYSTIALHLSIYATHAVWVGRRHTGAMVGAGILIALVGLSKQTIGPALALGLGAALAFSAPIDDRWRRFAILTGATLGGVAVGFGIVWLRGDLGAMIRSTILIPLSFEETYRLSFPNLWPPGVLAPEIAQQALFYMPPSYYLVFKSSVGRIPAFLIQIVYALPFIALLLAANRRRHGSLGFGMNLNVALLCSQLVHLYPRTDWGHIVFALPLALILFVLLAATRQPESAGFRRATIGTVVALGASSLALAVALIDESISSRRLGPRIRQRPVGEEARYDSLGRVINYIRDQTEPGDPIFVARAEPLVYFATETTNPTPYPGVIPAIREEQEQTILGALEDTKYVVMSEIDQPLFTYYRDVLPGVQRYLERFYTIPEEFYRFGENWMLVLERGEDRGEAVVDFFELQEEGRYWTLDAAGERIRIEPPRLELPNQYHRRPLVVRLGERGGGVDFDVEVPSDAQLQIDFGRRPSRNLFFGYLHASLGRTGSVWVARQDGEFRELARGPEISAQTYQGRAWIPAQVDLSAYAGESVQLRFAFTNAEPILDRDFITEQFAWFGSPRLVTDGPALTSLWPPAENEQVDAVVGEGSDGEVAPVETLELAAPSHPQADDPGRKSEE